MKKLQQLTSCTYFLHSVTLPPYIMLLVWWQCSALNSDIIVFRICIHTAPSKITWLADDGLIQTPCWSHGEADKHRFSHMNTTLTVWALSNHCSGHGIAINYVNVNGPFAFPLNTLTHTRERTPITHTHTPLLTRDTDIRSPWTIRASNSAERDSQIRFLI